MTRSRQNNDAVRSESRQARNDGLGEAHFDALDWFYSRSRRADSGRGFRDPLRTLRYVRKAIHGIAKWGGEAEEVWNVSRLRQFLLYLPLLFRFGHTIDEFYTYRLGTPEWRPHAQAFLPWRRTEALRRLHEGIGLDDGALASKARFERRCVEGGIPVIPTILELDRGEERWGVSGSRGLPATDIIVKPDLGLQGRGVRAYEKVPSGYRDHAGTEREAHALIDLWKEESRVRPLIVQPRLRNAREVSAWSTGALCAVRLVTTHRLDEPPVLLAGDFRMPHRDPVSCNFSRGAIAATIDLESGELGPAQSRDVAELLHGVAYERHPETGGRIAGVRLPRWDETIKVALSAHEQFSEFQSIGWDVAITEEGPVLIEGNQDWGTRGSQYLGPTPLGWTRLPVDMKYWFETRSTASR